MISMETKALKRTPLKRNSLKQEPSGTLPQHFLIRMLKALLFSYGVTVLLLLLLTILLYKAGLDEENINAGITVTYLISTLAGGFILGRIMKQKRFLWGIVLGILYFLLLFLISLGIYHTIQAPAAGILTTLAICTAGGAVGGMLS